MVRDHVAPTSATLRFIRKNGTKQLHATQHTQDQVFTRVHSRLRTCLLRHHHCQSPVTVADAVGQAQTKEVLNSLPPRDGPWFITEPMLAREGSAICSAGRSVPSLTL
ncbi:hypothetical protein T12_667 [Trichinella patagoniensis]|uniref:Uncharacterized protein n=1 Tax=Trichinella patagoniensis TaxID=990121 RepID=A0A0V0ZQ89_9BILA|nr:hypothetical protein T12_667 [Trichinella patagoniensis]